MENQHALKHVMSLQRNNANLGVRKCSKINVLLNREKIIYSPGHSSCFVEYFVLIIFTYYYKIFTSRAGRKEEFNSDTKVFINKWAFYVRIRFITPKNANYIQIRLLLLNSKRRYVTRILQSNLYNKYTSSGVILYLNIEKTDIITLKLIFTLLNGQNEQFGNFQKYR